MIPTLRYLLDASRLLLTAFTRLGRLRHPPVMRVLLRQLYFSGLESMSVTLILGAAIGVILVTEVGDLVHGNSSVSAKFLTYVMLRELGPLFSAIVFIARSGSAMASELAAMKVNGEVRELQRMGIEPLDYLVMPRVVGGLLAGVTLCVYLQLGALLSGALLIRLTSYNGDFPPLLQAMQPEDLAWSLLKAGLFSAWIGAATCSFGLRVGQSVTEIPQAASRAVINSMLAVFVLDGVITVLMSLGG